ncbi:hypothetical protein NKDENANG_03765 [Candidatus Entotheonellaceae bacterium PAL068K]
MQRMQRILCWVGVVGAMAITACTYEAAVQRLALTEQAEFRAYSKVMTSKQARTYLAKATAAERTTYLDEIGIAQRFQALEPQEREVVLAGGLPRKGMSAEAMRFLWGEPYEAVGHTDHYEHWFYLGSSVALADYVTPYHRGGTMVEVYLVNGRVAWWLEVVPTDEEGNDGDEREWIRSTR